MRVYPDLIVKEILNPTASAEELRDLAQCLRKLADAAAARAVELELDPENFIMQSVTERIQ